MLELTFLILGIIVIILIIYYKQNNTINITEQFENYYLSSCPAGYKSFYDNDGDIICCDGDVIANRCISDKKCSLNPKKNVPYCVDSILEDYKEKAKTYCPPSLPFYFEDRENQVKGCTNGKLNDLLNGPRSLSQPSCKIYSTSNKNIISKDSCYNMKMLDEAECFGNNCKKEIISIQENVPVLIGIGFTDSVGMFRQSYTGKSFESYLNVANPTWREQGIDLSKNINVAEVAKAFYVDKTIDMNSIQL
jgi:hypothetical protein